MVWQPILGAAAEGIGIVSEKQILKRKDVSYKNYTVLGFLAIVIVMIPLLFFYWKVSPQAYELKNILILVLVVILSLIANLLYFFSIKWEKVTALEPIRLLQPLFVIILALFLFPSERNLVIIPLAIIASLALIGSHIKKHHLSFNKYALATLFSSLFFAIELVASKYILEYYSSITFYFIRCFFIFLAGFLIFRTNPLKPKTKIKLYILAIGIIWVFYRIVLYYGYMHYGIVLTTLLFALAPVFTYFFSYIFLKEKPCIRNIIAAIVIVICVIIGIIKTGIDF